MQIKLDSRAARNDLTDRECTKLIGGLIGSLALMTDLAALRRAVRFWAEEDQLWSKMQETKKYVKENFDSGSRE